MTSYWCELAWLESEAVTAGVLIEVNGERIASVTPGVDRPPDNAIVLAGLTLPGFANVHSHAFHRALRGRAERGSGSFWTWRDGMYALADRLDPDGYHRLARATYAEMARAGITAVGEFHYLHHQAGGRSYADPNEVGLALTAAAREAGLRITLLDACYLYGGIGTPLNDVQRRFADADVDAWRERVDELMASEDGDIRVGAAIHSVRAVDPDSASVVASWAAATKRPLHAHLSEQPSENADCLAAYGATPTMVLAGIGVLHEQFTAVHATHLEPADIAELGGARCFCCLCPTTERDLADGIGPGAALVEAGAGLVLGSDSHAIIDAFEEARAIELDERLATGRRGHHRAGKLLAYATRDGHRSLGWSDGGIIEAGARGSGQRATRRRSARRVDAGYGTRIGPVRRHRRGRGHGREWWTRIGP